VGRSDFIDSLTFLVGQESGHGSVECLWLGASQSAIRCQAGLHSFQSSAGQGSVSELTDVVVLHRNLNQVPQSHSGCGPEAPPVPCHMGSSTWQPTSYDEQIRRTKEIQTPAKRKSVFHNPILEVACHHFYYVVC
jgi:hypothetical protein